MPTLIMPFFENSRMLALQYAGWAAWPDELKQRWKIILVDDGSPDPAVNVPRPDGLPELQIYRVLINRPWAQHGAKNIGAHEAPPGWLLLTDMDHVLKKKHAAKLCRMIDSGEFHAGAAYTLARYEADTGELTIGNNGQPKPHPNSYVMTRDTFWRVGGYDEDYLGVYGTDGLLRTRINQRATLGHLKNVALTRYWRDLIPDASTNSLERKEGRDPGAKRAIRDQKEARGEADIIKTLTLPYERVL